MNLIIDCNNYNNINRPIIYPAGGRATTVGFTPEGCFIQSSCFNQSFSRFRPRLLRDSIF